MDFTFALATAAAAIGSLHTLAPDHWVPFAALARAEGWSARRTAIVTGACGLGHVTASVLLGVVSLFFGLELMQAAGERLENISGVLLVGFGLLYGGWGLHCAMRARIHDRAHDVLPPHHHHGDQQAQDGHHHHRHHHHGDVPARRLTPWTLFLLFSADPCVAVVPLMFASAPLGWVSTLMVVFAYEVATIATMIALVMPMRLVARTVRSRWTDQYGDAIAGGVIATVGVAVTVLGI